MHYDVIEVLKVLGYSEGEIEDARGKGWTSVKRCPIPWHNHPNWNFSINHLQVDSRTKEPINSSWKCHSAPYRSAEANGDTLSLVMLVKALKFNEAKRWYDLKIADVHHCTDACRHP
jgi:hypothetical protein